MQRKSSRSYLLVLLCSGILVGCIPGVNQPYPTYTPDRTLEAIPRMLSATSGAPTITPTVFHTPTPTPPATATPPRPGSQALPGKLGERIQAGDTALMVLSTNELDTVGSQRKKAGIRYMDLEVIIANTGKAQAERQPVEYNRLFFLLQGNAGVYESLSEAAGPVLLSGSLRPGEWVRGHVAFAIPKDEQVQKLRYTQQNPGLAASDQNQEVWVRLDQQAVQKAPIPATGAGSLTPDLPGPGGRVEAKGLALRIDQVSAAKRIQWTKPEKGFIFVDLLVTLWNDGYDMVPFNAGYFHARDAQGYEYTPTTPPAEDMIHAGSLGRGQQVQGHVIFAVPEGTQELLLKYQPQVLTADYEEIRVGIPVPTAK